MTDNTEGAPFLLEADQGDFMSGAIGRDELGTLITAALAMPDVGSCCDVLNGRKKFEEVRNIQMLGRRTTEVKMGVASVALKFVQMTPIKAHCSSNWSPVSVLHDK
eukprot:scaffold51_cov23-Tisochrysis_lutea.AAC.1